MQAALKNIIIVLGLLGILGLGYYLFVIERDSTVPSNSIEVSQIDVETQNFLNKLKLIESFSLSTGIFTDPVFNSFVNFTTPIEAVPAGRDNPFAG